MHRVIWLKKYDGYGMEVPLDEVMKYVNNPHAIQMFEDDRVIKLDIPFSEIFHRCSIEEWDRVVGYVEQHFGTKAKWLENKRRKRIQKILVTLSITAGIVLAVWLISRF